MPKGSAKPGKAKASPSKGLPKPVYKRVSEASKKHAKAKRPAAAKARVDLSVLKTGPASVKAGEQVTYIMTVTNHSKSTSSAWTLTDQIPAGLENASTSTPGCTIVGGALTCKGRPLAPGKSMKITLTGTAGQGATKISSAATVRGSQPDPVSANNTGKVTTRVVPAKAAALTVKSSAPRTVPVGDPITYTIIVTNNGPNPSTGWTVTDPLPAGLLNPSTPTPGCTIVGGVLNCTGGPLAVGASATITVTGTAGPGFTSITNTATVTGNEPDPFPPNNTDTVITPLEPVPSTDLQVDKTGPAGPVAVGDAVTYTMTVTNNGPDASTGFSLSDPIPAGLQNASTPTAGCSVAGGVLTCTGGPLAAGASATITLTGTAGAGFTQIGGNTVTITPNEPDPVPPNNTDTTPPIPITPPAPSTDLQVDKTGPAGPVAVGDPVTYTMTVTNNGPSASTGWSLSDPIPAGLLNATTSTAGCGIGGGVLTCTGGPLAAGASATITLTGTAGPGITSITNTAVVDGNEPDPNTNNNTDTVTTPVSPAPTVDLAVNKTGPASAQVGDPVTYTITVINNGPDNSTGWTLTDAVPAGLQNASTSTPGCTIAGGVLTCTGGPLAAGASATVTLTGTAGPGITSITNTAVVDGNEPDPNTNNNTDTVTTPITPPAPSTDLQVDKTGPASAQVGDPVTYTITVTNNGPSASTGWTLTDPIPAGLLNATTSTAGCGIGGGVLTCTGGPLAAGASATITLTGTAGPGITSITNTAVVDGNEPDPNTNNNTDTVTTPVSPAPTVDLAVNKTGPASAQVGDPVTYTITVINNGPDNSTGWTLTDAVPAGLQNASTSTPGCTIAGGVLTCTGGPLAAGASATVTLTGTAGPGITSITNTAVVDGNEPDPNTNNNTDTVTTPVTPAPAQVDLAVDKTGPASAQAGDPVTYTIKVTNNGPDASTGWTLTDAIPAGLQNASTSTPGCTIAGGVLTCTGGPLAAGASATITLTGTAGPGITSITNTATVDGNEPDPVPGNDTDTVTTPITTPPAPSVDLAVNKTGPASVQAGDPLTYTISVTNNGPNASTGWTLTDQLPAGLLNPSTPTPGCSIVGSVLTCNGGPLAAGASVVISVSGTAAPTGVTSITNTVVVDGNEPDPVSGNDTDTVTTPVTAGQSVDLAVDKTGPDSAKVGDPITYTIKVTNKGPNPSTGWTLTDPIPAGLLNASTPTSGCSIAGGTLTCTGGPLAAGASINITLTGTVGPGFTGISNTAVVEGNQPDPVPGNNQDTVTTPVTARQADLAVDKSGPATAHPGDRVTYTIRVTNNGPGTATNWSLTDGIPAGLRGASTSTPGCVISGNVLTCTGAELAAGASKTITLTGVIDGGARVIENTAIVDSETTDPVPGNNSDTTTTKIKPKGKDEHKPGDGEHKPGDGDGEHGPGDGDGEHKPGGDDGEHRPGNGNGDHEGNNRPALQIVKQMNGPATVKPGRQVEYTITVRNTGDAPFTAANPARFTDNLAGLLDDANFNNDAEASVGDVNYDAPTLTWSGALSPGQTATITFSVTVKSRPFGDLKLDNKVVSNSPGSNCATGNYDANCKTTGRVIAPDKEDPRALGADLHAMRKNIASKLPHPKGEMAIKENMNNTK
ncbi:DUF11 domain-containing protein [Streptomyces sp. ISL-44]|uniref:DUF11 domain-containing protein n=1 Tax=Streptomyces sp. ISL-44 TaxID=2819184 RepID=UPI0027E24763|nr:DUF11 domain-containing protein [Streptomyces sp. ISL-44]